MEKTDWNKYKYSSKELDLTHKALMSGYNELLKNVKEEIKSIIELGCGTGRISYDLNEKYKPEEITLIDSNENAIETAKKVFKGKDNVEVIYEDIFRVSYDRMYDLCHSEGLVEHFTGEEQQQLINIHSNLVKTGGYVIIFVSTPNKTYNLSRKLAEKTGRWIFKDEVPLTKEQLQSIGEKASLKYMAHVYTKSLSPEVGILFKKE